MASAVQYLGLALKRLDEVAAARPDDLADGGPDLTDKVVGVEHL